MRAPLAPPRLSLPRKVEAEAQAAGGELGHRAACGQDVGLERSGVCTVDEGVVHGGHRVLPDERLGRYLRPEVALARPHVAVGQLVPGAGKGVGELVGMLIEPAGHLFVSRIKTHGQVRGQHGRLVALAFVVRVGYEVSCSTALGHPLLGAGGALAQLPIKTEEVFEVVVAPLRGRRGPNAFQSARDGVGSSAGVEGVLPTGALLGDGGPCGLSTDVLAGIGRTVCFSKGVSAGDQRHGLLVVHGHAAEGLADVAGGGEWIGVAVGSLRIHIDEAHLHGGEWVFQFALTLVALVGEPFRLGAPIDVLLGLPYIGAATGKAEGLEAHALQGDVAGEDHEVGPRNLLAVLLLDGPQQAAGLVEVGVVRPAVERRKAQHAGAGATAAVADPVGPGAVPSHANEEGAIVSPVSGPPVLGVGHQGGEVLLDRSQVEGLEFRSVIEVLAHGVGHAGMHAEDAEVELVGPPIGVAGAAAGTVIELAVHEGALRDVSVHMVVHVVNCVLVGPSGDFRAG